MMSPDPAKDQVEQGTTECGRVVARSLVEAYFEALEESKHPFLRLEGGESEEPVPFKGAAVFVGIKSSETGLTGRKPWKIDFQAVEVKLPESMGQVGTVMADIATQASSGMGNEYGLALYATDDGELRALVQRGGWFITTTQPEPFVQFPDGDKCILLGTLAHTHPGGEPVPSGGDHFAMAQNRNGPFGLRYGVLAVPGGSWSLFDEAEARQLHPRLAQEMPLESFFSTFWKDQTGLITGVDDLLGSLQPKAAPDAATGT